MGTFPISRVQNSNSFDFSYEFFESCTEYLEARFTSATLCLKSLRLSAMNIYALKDTTQSESTKSLFNAESVNEQMKKLIRIDQSFKCVILGN